MLGTIQSDEIDATWDEISPFVQRVIDKIDLYHTLKEIKEALKTEQMQLFVDRKDGIKSICVTQIVVKPNYKFLEIVLNAGHLSSVPLFRRIEQWAKEKGCKKVTLIGRPGWGKVLSDYKQTEITLEKEL